MPDLRQLYDGDPEVWDHVYDPNKRSLRQRLLDYAARMQGRSGIPPSEEEFNNRIARLKQEREIDEFVRELRRGGLLSQVIHIHTHTYIHAKHCAVLIQTWIVTLSNFLKEYWIYVMRNHDTNRK